MDDLLIKTFIFTCRRWDYWIYWSIPSYLTKYFLYTESLASPLNSSKPLGLISTPAIKKELFSHLPPYFDVFFKFHKTQVSFRTAGNQLYLLPTKILRSQHWNVTIFIGNECIYFVNVTDLVASQVLFRTVGTWPKSTGYPILLQRHFQTSYEGILPNRQYRFRKFRSTTDFLTFATYNFNKSVKFYGES